MTVTANDTMPTEVNNLQSWIYAVIKEVTNGDQQEVWEWSEQDLMNTFTEQESRQWRGMAERVRLALLEQAKSDLYDDIGEDAYHAYHYGE